VSGGYGGELQSVLENSACERLRTNTVCVRPSGQSRSLQGFFGVEVSLGIDAKGRSGREVGKCGFECVGGTDSLGAPRASGEETAGREYIMTVVAGEGTSEGAGEGRETETYDRVEEGSDGRSVERRRPASSGYIKWMWMSPKKLNPTRASVGGSRHVRLWRLSTISFWQLWGRAARPAAPVRLHDANDDSPPEVIHNPQPWLQPSLLSPPFTSPPPASTSLRVLDAPSPSTSSSLSHHHPLIIGFWLLRRCPSRSWAKSP
jgi:hypothetical protein